MAPQVTGLILVIVVFSQALIASLVAVSRRDSAVTIWAAGFLCSVVGFTFLLWEETGMPPLIRILAGNSFIVAFNGCLLVGTRFSLGLPRPLLIRFIVWFALWFILMASFSVVGHSYPVRAFLTSGLIEVFSVELFFLVVFRGRSMPKLVRNLFGFLACCEIAFHGFRMALVLNSHALSVMSDAATSNITFLFNIFQSILWFGALLLWDGARLQAQVSARSEELARLNRLKDHVIRMAGHDLRGPLGNLHVIWQELASRFKAGVYTPEDDELLALVDRSLSGTENLLENVFRYADAQQKAPDPSERTELATVLRSVLDLWEPAARTKGVELTLGKEERLFVCAAPEAVEAVVRNLVANAVKFTPRGGSVTVGLVRRGDRGVVEVADTGIGMDWPHLESKFVAGERVSRPGTEGERGSGFGLVLVRELVSQWKGELEIVSEPGHGTLVKVSFLAAESPC